MGEGLVLTPSISGGAGVVGGSDQGMWPGPEWAALLPFTCGFSRRGSQLLEKPSPWSLSWTPPQAEGPCPACLPGLPGPGAGKLCCERFPLICQINVLASASREL